MAGNASQDRRYAPPAAHVDDVAVPSGEAGRVVTRTRRFWAAMIDVGIASAAALLLDAVLPWDPWGADRSQGWWSFEPRSALTSLAVFLVLHGVLLVRSGQTLGKAMLGLRIVRSDGGKATPFQVLAIRYGFFYALTVMPVVGGIVATIDALLIFRRSRRCLHDTLADTIVVRA